jgi:hypothetical protein
MATSYLDDFSDDAFDELKEQGIKSKPNDSIPALTTHFHFRPVFGFDYLSLNQGPFCFNNPAIPSRDFVELLRRFQRISLLTYSEIQDKTIGNGYHFHEVEKHRLNSHGLADEFQKKLVGRTRALPPVYQFALYTDKNAAPRVLGYIGKWGIFYLLWLDYGHLLYPENAPAAPAPAPSPAPPSNPPGGLRADGRPKRPRLPPTQ